MNFWTGTALKWTASAVTPVICVVSVSPEVTPLNTLFWSGAAALRLISHKGRPFKDVINDRERRVWHLRLANIHHQELTSPLQNGLQETPALVLMNAAVSDDDSQGWWEKLEYERVAAVRAEILICSLPAKKINNVMDEVGCFCRTFAGGYFMCVCGGEGGITPL